MNIQKVPRLIYFNISFWRGEVPRILFYMSGTEFEDIRLTREMFDSLRTRGELPFGHVPVLYVGNNILTQACAIMRYLAKDAGVLPDTRLGIAKMDEVLHLLEEFHVYIAATMRSQIPETNRRIRARKILAEQTIPKYFGYFNTLLGNNTYFVEGRLSLADICVWKTVQWVTSGVLDYIPTSIANNFKALVRNYRAVDNNVKIIEWKERFPQYYDSSQDQ